MRKRYKCLFGFVVTVVVGSATTFWAVRHFDVSLRFLVERALEKGGVENPRLDLMLQPPHLYASGKLDGQVRLQHPRILLPGLTGWDGSGISPLMVERLALFDAAGVKLNNYSSCGREHAMSHVVCWLTTGSSEEARHAIGRLMKDQIALPTTTNNGSVTWEWALAFDLLALFPGLTEFERNTIAGKLQENLRSHLQLLDDESVSLWHGRSTLAAQAWLLAVALHGEPIYEPNLTVRAQGHFRQAISALALTEAWPEGYNYWINSRGLGLALASSAYVNGLEESQFASSVQQAIRRVGLWTVYATRPDHRMEAIGDEGPRVDLKDETRRVIDLIAQLTGDSIFASYSSYLERIHLVQSYYRGFRWNFVLFNDPSIPPLPGIAAGTLVGLERYLPLTELFGAGAFNLLIARTGWGPDDTLITLRAGHTFTHHGHYDAGHFTIFKGAPLAVNSSKYNGFFSPNRLYYSIRTVAKNSLLIVRPGDVNQPHPRIERPVNDGGQRLVMPTGSRIRDITHWNSHFGAGNHLEGGELLEYQFKPGHFTYARTDLTGAYDSIRYDSQGSDGKVRSVGREMLYLYGEDRLLLRDKVVAMAPFYKKKWLMHTVHKPQLKNTRVILGNEETGILESEADKLVVENGRGRLDVKRILPEEASLRLVGGNGFEYYIEDDDTNNSNGAGYNFSEGAADRPWFDNSSWRLEILPTVPQISDEFVIALSPSLGSDRSREVNPLDLLSGEASAVATSDYVVVFTGRRRLDEVSFALPDDQRALLLVGVVATDSFELVVEDTRVNYEAALSGVMELELPVDVRQGSILSLRQK